MTAFHVGQEVVCVGSGNNVDLGQIAYLKAHNYAFPKRGEHYIVRGYIEAAGYDPGIYLAEIPNPPVPTKIGLAEVGWLERCFRPVRREAIEVFRQMCISNKPLVPVE